MIYHNTQDWVETLEAYNIALEAFRATEDDQMVWSVLFGTSSVYSIQGRFNEAYQLLAEALSLTGVTAQDPNGAPCTDLTVTQPASWTTVSLLPLARGATLNNMGVVIGSATSQEQRISNGYAVVDVCFQAALQTLQQLNGQSADAEDVLPTLAAQIQFGKNQKDALREMMSMIPNGNLNEIFGGTLASQLAKLLEPIFLSNLGQLYALEGTYEQAQPHLEQALQQIKANQVQHGLTVADVFPLLSMSNLSETGTTVNDNEVTKPIMRELLVGDFTKMIGSFIVFLNFTSVARNRTNHTEAGMLNNSPLGFILQVNDIVNLNSEAIVLNNLASIYNAQGLIEQAHTTFQDALALYENKLANYSGAVTVHVNLGWLAQQVGYSAEALDHYKQAINLLALVRPVAEGDVAQLSGGNVQTLNLVGNQGILSQQADVYALVMNLYLQQGKNTEALQTLEQGRSRLFFDMMSTSNPRLPNQDADLLNTVHKAFELYIQAITFVTQARTIAVSNLTETRAVDDSNLQRLIRAEHELKVAEELYRTQLKALETYTPKLLSLAPGMESTLDLARLQTQMLSDTTLIVYYIAEGLLEEPTDQLAVAWVIDGDSIDAVQLDTTGADIRMRVDAVRKSIDIKDFYVEAADLLYRDLIVPVKPYIEHNNLIIVPYGSLYYLPFAALWDVEAEHYLVEDYAITYAPTVSSLPLIWANQNPNENRLLAMANNTAGVPSTVVSEVLSITQPFSTTPWLNEQATKARFIAESGKFDLIHLAAGGRYDDVDPLASFIELAPDANDDGRLQVGEIFNLKLAEANLVVLSACQTALGEQSLGDEITGLTHAFLYAGAPAVIASLWSIEDKATEALMISFYQHLRTETSFAAALRAAQLDILGQERWRDPFYWAAFTLTGSSITTGERNPPDWAAFTLTGETIFSDPISLAAERAATESAIGVTNQEEELLTIESEVQQGNYSQGILSSLQLSPTFAGSETLFEQFRVRMNLGTAYLYAGDRLPVQRYPLAEEYFHAASTAADKMNNIVALITAQNSLSWLKAQSGMVEQNSRWLTEAETELQQALESWKEFNNNPSKVVQVLEQLALIALAKNNNDDALTLVQEALRWSEQSDTPVKTHLYIVLGIARLKANDGTRSLDAANQAFQLATELDDQLSKLGSHTLLAMIHAANGDNQQAYEQLRLATSYLEGAQEESMATRLQTTFLHQLADVHTIAISLAVDMGLLEESFYYAEQSREHSFLELSNQRFDIRANADLDMIRQEQTLRQQMTELEQDIQTERNKPLSQQQGAKLNTLQNDLESMRSDYTELLTLLKATNLGYASSTFVQSPSLQDVQEGLLDEKTTLVRYLVTEQETLIWVITRDDANIVQIPVAQQTLAQQIQFLRDQIAVREPDRSVAARLYDALWSPLKEHIHFSNLVIVPDDILHHLPFAALWDADNERYLVQDYALTQIPSVSALSYITGRRNPNQGRLLVMGNPDASLPFAEQEAKEIATLYNTAPLLRQQATERDLYAKANQSDILHLAANGVHDSLYPLFSYIELSPGENYDGKLEVHEVYNQLDLQGVNLVVVTADKTQPTNNNDDEATGFTQAFLYAGAPNVMTSQWTVADEATAFLMKQFYTYLKEGIDTPEALRRAQTDTMQQPEFTEPYYWAGFTLVGDYKNDYAVAVTAFIPWPWIASISVLIALLLSAVGFVYVRIAQPNDIPIPVALQLMRLSITMKGGYLAYHWSDFQYRIQKALYEEGRVTGHVLHGLPKSLWTDALRRYFLEKLELDLIFDEEQQLLKHRKAELVRTFNGAWENAQQAINSRHDGVANINQVVHSLAQFVDLEITIPTANQIGQLRYFPIEASPAFPDLPRIKMIPLIIHIDPEWRENDLDAIRQILRRAHSAEHPLSTHSIGVAISFIDPVKIQDIKVQIDRKLRRTYACDVNLLGKEDILHILFQKDARQAFASAVLQDANLEILSPYQTEGPVSPDAFFGRESDLRKITENVHRHSYAIIGGRKIGKSSLWLQLHQRRLLATDFYTLVLDCQTINSYEQFLATSVQEGQARLPLSLSLPTTVSVVLTSLPFDKPLIVLLDEADKLVGPDRQAHWPLFNRLRSLINSGRMQMILFGEYTLLAALQDDNGPLYNLAESMILGVLEYPAVEELVMRPMKQLRIDFVDEAAVVQQIYRFTSGHPAIVQSLCNRLVVRLNEQKRRTIGVDDVNAVLETPQFQDEDFLKVYLAQATPLEEIIVLLLTHHPGVHRLTGILKLVEEEAQIYPGAEATRAALDRLVKLRSILRYSPQGYDFTVEAFPHLLANSVTVADQLAVKLEKYKQEESKA